MDVEFKEKPISNAKGRLTTYRELPEEDDPEDIQTFGEYAAEHWPAHMHSSQKHDSLISIEMALELYNMESDKYQFWFGIFWNAYSPYHRRRPRMTAIQLAAFNGHDNILQRLLKLEDIDLESKNHDENTALVLASQKGHAPIVQTLLDRGAEVNAQGGEYGNALQAASIEGHASMVQMLLDRGAETNAQGGYDGNALQVASEHDHALIVQMLLQHAADMRPEYGELSR
ncbi:MAG: hypothetical protein MMC23_005803 [Stictis urceolatum]|nr:hypothetical protein [Stictis urceolata]